MNHQTLIQIMSIFAALTSSAIIIDMGLAPAVDPHASTIS